MDRYLDRDKAILRVVSAASRRFPGPWRVRELQEALVIEDVNGAQIAYISFYAAPMRSTSTLSSKLTRDEAKRLAATMAKLSEMPRREP